MATRAGVVLLYQSSTRLHLVTSVAGGIVSPNTHCLLSLCVNHTLNFWMLCCGLLREPWAPMQTLKFCKLFQAKTFA